MINYIPNLHDYGFINIWNLEYHSTVPVSWFVVWNQSILIMIYIWYCTSMKSVSVSLPRVKVDQRLTSFPLMCRWPCGLQPFEDSAPTRPLVDESADEQRTSASNMLYMVNTGRHQSTWGGQNRGVLIINDTRRFQWPWVWGSEATTDLLTSVSLLTNLIWPNEAPPPLRCSVELCCQIVTPQLELRTKNIWTGTLKSSGTISLGHSFDGTTTDDHHFIQTK